VATVCGYCMWLLNVATECGYCMWLLNLWFCVCFDLYFVWSVYHW